MMLKNSKLNVPDDCIFIFFMVMPLLMDMSIRCVSHSIQDVFILTIVFGLIVMGLSPFHACRK